MSLGTHDAQTSYHYRSLHRMEYWSRWVWDASSASQVLTLSCQGPQTHCGIYTCLHWRQSRTLGSLPLVSVTTKHTSLHWACNRHSPVVELPNATGQTGKTEFGDLFHLRQSLLLDHSGMEGASSRIIFESSGSLKQEQRPFFGFWYLHCCYYYLDGSYALRSFIYVDVGELTSHPCSMTGVMQGCLP